MDDRPWIVLLGANNLNAGFNEIARLWNARLAAVDWHETIEIPCDAHIRLDIKDAASILPAVRALSGGIALAYTSTDVAAETAAQINADAGFARASAESLSKANSKLAMNAAWTA